MARKRNKRKSRKTIAIVGDGHTEKIYFEDYRNSERPESLTIKPDLPGKKSGYNGVLSKAIDLKIDGYDEVIAIIDMDILKNKNQKDKYKLLKDKANAKGVLVLENNPCMEFWFLIHFIKSHKLFTNGSSVIAELRKNNRIPDYQKNQKWQRKTGLFNLLKKALIEKAITNGKYVESVQNDSSAQIYRLFEKDKNGNRILPLK